MTLKLAPWSAVNEGLPQSGRHLLACHDADTITVFAAHDEAIGAWAVAKQRFGGAAWKDDRILRFRLSLPRVMARSQRGEREGKERVLALTLSRPHFDAMLRQAIHWREFPEGVYDTRGQWRLATRYSQVLLDWAPDCDPGGADLSRFTPRFGARAMLLKQLPEWILHIEDLSELAQAWREQDDPLTAEVAPYPLPEPELAKRLLWSAEG